MISMAFFNVGIWNLSGLLLLKFKCTQRTVLKMNIYLMQGQRCYTFHFFTLKKIEISNLALQLLLRSLKNAHMECFLTY